MCANNLFKFFSNKRPAMQIHCSSAPVFGIFFFVYILAGLEFYFVGTAIFLWKWKLYLNFVKGTTAKAQGTTAIAVGYFKPCSGVFLIERRTFCAFKLVCNESFSTRIHCFCINIWASRIICNVSLQKKLRLKRNCESWSHPSWMMKFPDWGNHWASRSN